MQSASFTKVDALAKLRYRLVTNSIAAQASTAAATSSRE